MDKLGDAISNISIYDVKAYVRKAQNAVLNFSEMETKVREATNNEPWGTSTTLMQEIAEGTNSYQQFHEIMPFVYRRFTEKSASEWRQIYKALQLLEYLVKNGSERVVDYARSHTAVIDMLRHFQYTDSSGRDQGINIRNRADELLSLLSSTDKLRAERKRNKQLNMRTGVGSGRTPPAMGSGPTGFSASSSSRSGRSKPSSGLKFGGGGYDQTVYGDGGGFDGSNYSSNAAPSGSAFQDDGIDEYDAGVRANGSGSRKGSFTSSKAAAPSPVVAPEPDLLSFGDVSSNAPSSSVKPTSTSTASAATQKVASSTAASTATSGLGGDDDDDEFDDFQSAPVSTMPAVNKSSILGLYSNSTVHSSTSESVAPAPANYDIFGSLSSASFSSSTTPVASQPAYVAPAAAAPKPDAFSSLWDIGKTAAANAPVLKPAAQSHSGGVPSPSSALPSATASVAKPASNTPAQPKPQFNGDDLLMF